MPTDRTRRKHAYLKAYPFLLHKGVISSQCHFVEAYVREKVAACIPQIQLSRDLTETSIEME